MAYAYGLARNHPFIDDNKRTAYVSFRLFLCVNGYDIDASREDKYIAMLQFAEGMIAEDEFAKWIGKYLVSNTTLQ